MHAETPASEEIRAALRQTTHAYPKKALHEILGNALVRQDLAERGTGVVVEVYDDRVEVVNPGRPLLDVGRFIDENQSRNLLDGCLISGWAALLDRLLSTNQATRLTSCQINGLGV